MLVESTMFGATLGQPVTEQPGALLGMSCADTEDSGLR